MTVGSYLASLPHQEGACPSPSSPLWGSLALRFLWFLRRPCRLLLWPQYTSPLG